jgi:pyruvate dehydrogenase E2 component (dihydrolipoamide acetyltransferase)
MPPSPREVRVPDIGNVDRVSVVDVLVRPGDVVHVDDPLITLESDKASMDVPSPAAGKVVEVKVARGDKVGANALILLLEPAAEAEAKAAAGAAPAPAETAASGTPAKQEESALKQEEPAPAPRAAAPPAVAAAPPPAAPAAAPPSPPAATPPPIDEAAFAQAYASPAVRRLARELGVDLGRVAGSGRGGRVLKEDVQGFVKTALAAPAATALLPGLQPPPVIDFARFGPVERRPLTRIQKVAGPHLHRAWLQVPHVTQFDEADITELEEFRQVYGEEARARDIKLTLLPFVIKACVAALREFPQLNASLAPGGEEIVLKRYFHVGVAVDTPEGLVVPVIRDADRKGLLELAQELAATAQRARERKLKPDDLQGGSFSISSLGGIGGTAFTPIVNFPEVAILGVSRAALRPVHQDGGFVPRRILPLSLSYDHRVVDGAAAARFVTYLSGVLGDIRKLLL